MEELADILAVRFDEYVLPKFNPDWRLGDDAQEAVLSVCSNLISVIDVNGSQIVQFSHFSVKEFLTSNRLATATEDLSGYHIVPLSAHTTLAQASLSVLLQLDNDVDRDSIKGFPLSSYAAQHWVDHGKVEGVSPAIQVAMEQLFNPHKPHFTNWVWIYDMDDPWRGEMPATPPQQPAATPLYYAVLCGFHHLIEHLIASYPGDVDARGGYYGSPLLAAFTKKDINVALSLLQQGANVNILDESNRSPLHRAAEGGLIDIADLLLKHDATDVDLPDFSGNSALSIASYNGQMEIVRLLLQRGADVNLRNGSGTSSFHQAAKNGHLDIARYLLECGADIDSCDKDGQTPLHSASQQGHIEIAELLIQHGTDVGSCDNNGWTPLHRASSRGHAAMAELLIRRGADLGSRNNDSWTPLHLAALWGHFETVKLLLECGADRNIRDDKNKTPSDLASDNNKLDVANFLSRSAIALEEEVRPNASSPSPQHLRPDVAWSPQTQRGNVEPSDDERLSICAASRNGNIDVVRSLLDHGSDIEQKDSDRRTPLALASRDGQLEMAKLLIERGAYVDSREPEGWTPLHLASRYGHFHIVRLLLDHNAEIDARQRNQRTALDLAAYNGHLETVEILIRCGADTNVRNSYGRTPRQEALASGNCRIAELLPKHGSSP